MTLKTLFIISFFTMLYSPLTVAKEHLFKDKVFKVKTYVTELGRANPDTILLVHGLSHNAANAWGEVAPELAKSYHVLKIELPGFGRSERSEKELYTPENYAKYIDEVVRKYARDSKVIVVGHSLGGAISLTYVSMFSEHVRKLVLVATAGILQRSVFIRNLARIDKKEEKSVLSGLYNKTVGLINGVAGAIFDFGDRFSNAQDVLMSSGKLRKLLVKDQTVVRAAIALIETNYAKVFEKIRVPTLILWGDADKIAPIRSALIIDTQVEDSSLIIFPKIGHNPMTEIPGKVSDNILSWLSKPISIPALPSNMKEEFKKEFNCKDKQNIEISGAYESIRLRNCRNIKLNNVKTKRLRMRESSAEVVNLEIQSDDFAIEMKESTLVGTNLRIETENVFKLNASKLDLAAATINYTKKLMTVNNKSTIWWSVSRAQRKFSDEVFLHRTKSYR